MTELRQLHIYRARVPSRDLTKIRDMVGIPSWHIIGMRVYMCKSAAASAGLQGGFSWPILWTPPSYACMCVYACMHIYVFIYVFVIYLFYVNALPALYVYTTCVPGACGSQKGV